MHDTPIRELMTAPAISITADLSLDVALELLRSHDIRRLPVTDARDRVVGIITEEDALLAMPEGATFLGESGAFAPDIPPIKKVMSTDVHVIGPDEPVSLAARMMVDHKIGALPVVREDSVIGIVTESDLFRHIARSLAEPTAAGSDASS